MLATGLRVVRRTGIVERGATTLLPRHHRHRHPREEQTQTCRGDDVRSPVAEGEDAGDAHTGSKHDRDDAKGEIPRGEKQDSRQSERADGMPARKRVRGAARVVERTEPQLGTCPSHEVLEDMGDRAGAERCNRHRQAIEDPGLRTVRKSRHDEEDDDHRRVHAAT